MSDAYRIALEQARQDLQDKVNEIKATPLMADILALHQTLNGLECLLKQSRTSLGDVFNLGSSDADATAAIRFDEFVGLSTLESAKKYLKKRRDARPFQEILDAIKQGGGKVESEEELRSSLTRSTMDIVKIQDRFGAIENYPHIKRGGKSKKKVSEANGQPTEAASPQSPENGEE